MNLLQKLFYKLFGYYPKTVTIKVIQEDIDAGRQYHGNYCPIALAAKRVFSVKRNSSMLFAVQRGIEITKDGIYTNRICYINPTEASKWMTNFDLDITVKPFEFEIVKRKKKQEEEERKV